ncbi:MAG: pseudouridine synthase [Pseudomonadota bacterium]
MQRDAHGAAIMVHDPQRTGRASSGQARLSEDDPSGEDPTGGERIAKLLARSGVGSRRDVERLIEEGRVAINGQVLTTPAVKVEAGDIITVDGAVVGEPEPVRVFRYHKPVGLVTTHKDPQGRPTVFEALPRELPRLISVGRLDLNSEGLLLLTNDGGLARALELPATGIVRRYRARAHGRITQERLDRLKDGITVEGVRYGSIDARLDKAKDGPQGANLWLTVTLHEGKNREVRRVLEAVGLKVNRLIRLSYGPFALGTLGVGEVEEVGPRVIREQLSDFILPENLPKGDRPQYRSPAAKSRRARQEAAATELVPPPPEPKARKAYKAGWAKPKPKPGHAKGPSKAKLKAKIEGKTLNAPRTPTGPKPAARARPAAPARPGPARPGPRRPGPKRPGQGRRG